MYNILCSLQIKLRMTFNVMLLNTPQFFRKYSSIVTLSSLRELRNYESIK